MRTILFLASLTLLVGCNNINNSGQKRPGTESIPVAKTELSKAEEQKLPGIKPIPAAKTQKPVGLTAIPGQKTIAGKNPNPLPVPPPGGVGGIPSGETIPAAKTELSKEEELKMLEEFAAHHTLQHRFAVQEGREASEYYGVYGIPQVVLVDQQGKVRMIKVGSGEQNARDVEDSIRGLLKLSPLEELPPVKKPLPVKPAAAADPKKTLKDNPNDLKAYSSYMRSFSTRFYSLLKKDPKKAEELVKEEEIFIRSLEKPSDEKANLTYRRLSFLPVNYRTSIKVETTSLPDLKKDLESNLGSASARRLYQMKVSGHIPSSLAKDDPDAAEKKVLVEKKFLESLKPKVSGQIEDPETAKKATEAITSLIDRYLGGIERRIDSSRRHTELLAGGEMMPLAKIDWVNGKPLTDNDLKGKVVLVDFWAVWCGPCIATFPHLREWHDKYADKGFEIIGYTSYYKRYDWKDGKLIRLQTPKPKLPIKRK